MRWLQSICTEQQRYQEKNLIRRSSKTEIVKFLSGFFHRDKKEASEGLVVLGLNGSSAFWVRSNVKDSRLVLVRRDLVDEVSPVVSVIADISWLRFKDSQSIVGIKWHVRGVFGDELREIDQTSLQATRTTLERQR